MLIFVPTVVLVTTQESKIDHQSKIQMLSNIYLNSWNHTISTELPVLTASQITPELGGKVSTSRMVIHLDDDNDDDFQMKDLFPPFRSAQRKAS